jgi:hypothetical protein
LALAGRSFSFERIGNFTTVRCSADAASPDCQLLESMDVQPQMDWDRLLAKAKVKLNARPKSARSKSQAGSGAEALAEEFAVDRYGGPWKAALRYVPGRDTPDFLKPFTALLSAGFPGYKVTVQAGKVTGVEVLRDLAQWDAAKKELGLDEAGQKKKRFKLGGLFDD